MTKLTEKWLRDHNACNLGITWFLNQEETDPIKLITQAIKKKQHLDWANWLIVRLMKYKQYVLYAVFAAEQVIDIFEKEYPDDDRPRKAIEAAKKCIKRRSKKNKAIAYAAVFAVSTLTHATAWASDATAWAAAAAAWASNAAWAAYDAAHATAWASDAAAWAAPAAAAWASNAAWAAYDAAWAAAWAAARAASAARAAINDIRMMIKILKYGLSLLKGGKK